MTTTMKVKEIQKLLRHPLFSIKEGISFDTMFKLTKLAKQFVAVGESVETRRLDLIKAHEGTLNEEGTEYVFESPDGMAKFTEAFGVLMEEEVEIDWDLMPTSRLGGIKGTSDVPLYQFMEPIMLLFKDE